VSRTDSEVVVSLTFGISSCRRMSSSLIGGENARYERHFSTSNGDPGAGSTVHSTGRKSEAKG
jgi:hypothetical protein